MPSAVAEVRSNSMHFLDKEMPCRKWIHYFAIFFAHQPTNCEAHIIFVLKEKRYVSAMVECKDWRQDIPMLAASCSPASRP